MQALLEGTRQRKMAWIMPTHDDEAGDIAGSNDYHFIHFQLYFIPSDLSPNHTQISDTA